jgi:hypothetical protein
MVEHCDSLIQFRPTVTARANRAVLSTTAATVWWHFEFAHGKMEIGRRGYGGICGCDRLWQQPNVF